MNNKQISWLFWNFNIQGHNVVPLLVFIKEFVLIWVYLISRSLCKKIIIPNYLCKNTVNKRWCFLTLKVSKAITIRIFERWNINMVDCGLLVPFLFNCCFLFLWKDQPDNDNGGNKDACKHRTCHYFNSFSSLFFFACHYFLRWNRFLISKIGRGIQKI